MADWAGALDDVNHGRGDDFFPDPETVMGCEALQANLTKMLERASMWDYRRNNGTKREKANAGAIFGILRNNIDAYERVMVRDCYPENSPGGDIGASAGGGGNTDAVQPIDKLPAKADQITTGAANMGASQPASSNSAGSVLPGDKKNLWKWIGIGVAGLLVLGAMIVVIKKSKA